MKALIEHLRQKLNDACKANADAIAELIKNKQQ